MSRAKAGVVLVAVTASGALGVVHGSVNMVLQRYAAFVLARSAKP
ncbi:hypothetical protein [Roseateles sp.]